MNDHFPPRPHEPSGIDGDYRPAAANQSAPTEWFPAVQFPAEPFTAAQSHTAQFPTANLPGQPHNRPREPLAHEGGLAYGNPPAAPYGHPDQFVPQHLAAPQQYAPGMYAPGMYPPGPPYQQQFMPHQMPQQQMHQNVFVNGGGGGKRVNHLLHLILTLLTAGLWLPVWIIIAMAKS